MRLPSAQLYLAALHSHREEAEGPEAGRKDTMIKHYVVEGMTSEENGTAVETEITDLPGTQGVEVDVAAGTVSVTGEGFTDADIAHAVETAGFTLRLED